MYNYQPFLSSEGKQLVLSNYTYNFCHFNISVKIASRYLVGTLICISAFWDKEINRTIQIILPLATMNDLQFMITLVWNNHLHDHYMLLAFSILSCKGSTFGLPQYKYLPNHFPDITCYIALLLSKMISPRPTDF